MTATRRLAAIMAIDVVGYSRLMGEDEAGTAVSVREHRDAARPIVAGLGGRMALEPKVKDPCNQRGVPPRNPTTSLSEPCPGPRSTLSAPPPFDAEGFAGRARIS